MRTEFCLYLMNGPSDLPPSCWELGGRAECLAVRARAGRAVSHFVR